MNGVQRLHLCLGATPPPPLGHTSFVIARALRVRR